MSDAMAAAPFGAEKLDHWTWRRDDVFGRQSLAVSLS